MRRISDASSGFLKKLQHSRTRGMMMRQITMVFLTILVCTGGLVFASGNAVAQLNTEPSALALPDFNLPDPDRAVVISVQFNNPTDVQLQNVIVANVRAKGSLGAPPLIKLELLDRTGAVIREQNDWHPLWVRESDIDGLESNLVMDSGPGTFYVPLSVNLVAVRITDVSLSQELITVDVSTYVDAYCAAKPLPEICILFHDGFE